MMLKKTIVRSAPRGRQRGFLLNSARFSVPDPIGDPLWAKTVALIHFDDTNGATSFTDSSARNSAWTGANGTAISTAKALFGDRSLRNPTPPDTYNTFAYTNYGAPLAVGSRHFTLEFAFNSDVTLTTGSDKQLAGVWGSSGYLSYALYYSNGVLYWHVATSPTNGADAALITYTGTFNANTWYRLAICGDSTNFYLFIEGALVGTTARVDVPEAGNALSLGSMNANSASSTSLVGHFAELRYTIGEGACRYTSSYTPRSSPFPNTFPPGASNKWRLTGLAVTGTFLEVSELHLYEGGVLAVGPTLTCNYAAGGGTSVSALYDENTSTRAYWNAADANASDFYIEFEFPIAKAITGIRFAGFDTADRFSTQYTLKYWTGSSWLTFGAVSGLTYPGNNTYSAVIPAA